MCLKKKNYEQLYVQTSMDQRAPVSSIWKYMNKNNDDQSDMDRQKEWQTGGILKSRGLVDKEEQKDRRYTQTDIK